MKAAEYAARAAKMVAGDRGRQHGPMEQNFSNIASLWNSYISIRRDPASPLSAEDVGHMMALLKVARTQSGARNDDDLIDAIGYLACAGQIGTK